MIVVDTSVLVYAKGAEHPLREPCRRLLVEIAGGRLAATTTIEVVQEFAHVRARRYGRSDALDLALDYVEGLSPLLPVTEAVLRAGLRLFAHVGRLGAFDAVLAAAALHVGADALVSADRAFADVPGLAHVRPDGKGVAGLLGG
ncbi:MAG TPA: type II toxin-antitoxin system VapC family toxin [Frankiaceae bacterium]|nr:type II toxin-antitoxin system VapC family toxin [Frankiaceae bacterium]